MTFYDGFLVGSSENVKRDSVKNLWKMNLSKQARLIYTIFSDSGGYSVLVLEVFLSHKSYNKRFGYS